MSRPKVALITRVTGRDGAYLSELVLDKGCEAHGIKRRASLFNADRIDHRCQNPRGRHQRFKPHHIDLTGNTNLVHMIEPFQPDEIRGLASASNVPARSETPGYAVSGDGICAPRTRAPLYRR